VVTRNYSVPRRLRRPDSPTPMAQTPTINMAKVDGTGAGTRAGATEDNDAAWTAPATRLAQTGINNNFIAVVCRMRAGFKTNQGSKTGLVGTDRPSGGRADRGGRFQYRCLVVMALLFSVPMLSAEPEFVEVKLPAHFDPLSPNAKAQYEAAAREACKAPKPAEFAGYFWRLPSVAAELRLMTGASEGKHVYIDFLKTKYGYNINSLNHQYGTDAQSFTELLESPIAHVDATRQRVHEDDAEFDSFQRTEMFDGIRTALRQCDPQHADGGIRYLLEFATGRR
jgi:hypothetical protein